MTQAEKDLLLKDLCARLYTCNCIYGTALTVALVDEQPLVSNQWLISNYDCYKDEFIVSNIVYASDVERVVDIDNIRPYLFPLSSMTDGQRIELYKALGLGYQSHYHLSEEWEHFNNSINNNDLFIPASWVSDINKMYNYLDKNHFDYRGLIEKGLAIDATDKNIY